MASVSELPELALIEVSSTDPATPNRKLTGTIESRAQKTIILPTREEIVPYSAIRVQTKHLLSFGEVLSCIRDANTTWKLHICVERSIMII